LTDTIDKMFIACILTLVVRVLPKKPTIYVLPLYFYLTGRLRGCRLMRRIRLVVPSFLTALVKGPLGVRASLPRQQSMTAPRESLSSMPKGSFKASTRYITQFGISVFSVVCAL
jgi:hypothetical protein